MKSQKSALAESFTSASDKINRARKGGTLSPMNLRFLVFHWRLWWSSYF